MSNEEDEPQRYTNDDDDDNLTFDAQDVLLGMKYASLAISDDKPDTLKNVGKLNPWHIEALKLITGSRKEAHQPLSYILEKYMNLTVDAQIDKTGTTPGMHFIDTQGYIAHNDDVIVLAFRCTTSVFDWLTNFNTTSSAWELEEDVAQGYSGQCSGWDGIWCCRHVGREYKPRVHTGFYNNFLATVPDIRQYLEPLLLDTSKPRKLYVCGHSLGAGVATMAACYFLLEHDWATLPHSLVVVTAGSPRACQNSMRETILRELTRLRREHVGRDKVTFCRIVRDRDIVPTLPPAMFGFRHIDDLVFISETGEIQMNPNKNKENESEDGDQEQATNVVNEVPTEFKQSASESKSSLRSAVSDMSEYERKISRIPKPLRDHMPDSYLKPLMRNVGESIDIEDDDGEDEEGIEVQADC